ncbi:MAG: 50S ribosomal protein L4 [Thermoplasmata archaeon]
MAEKEGTKKPKTVEKEGKGKSSKPETVKKTVKGKPKKAEGEKKAKGKPKARTVKKKDEGKSKKTRTVKKKGKPTKAKAAKKKAKPKPKKVEKVNLYSITGKAKKKIKLPKVFFEDVRIDLIRKAVKASQANRRQPYGPNPGSGMSHAVSTWGKGRGVSRVQRFTQGRTAAESPNVVGGRRAHPPRTTRDWSLKINDRERRKARNSALSATKEASLISQRGHKFKKSITVPIVVEDSIEKIVTVKEAMRTLEKLGVKEDLKRARSGIHIRAGRGKMRGRRYRKPKSLLLVVRDHKRALRGFSNLPGIDVTTPEHLSVEILAPGGTPGRLTLFTEGALKRLEGW